MILPASLINHVKRGNAILFLGSGGLIGAKLPGKNVPLGNDLRDLLDANFLGGEFGTESLAHVAALAISQNSLSTVQDYIKDYFQDIRPTSFHLKIPEFKWKALFTTNYDRLIEKCYEQNPNKIQKYSLILSKSDKIDETGITNDYVYLVKLHGCITRTHEESLPLILTVDQYNESLSERKPLFKYLYEQAFESTIIFIGHSLQDPNIRSVLLSVSKEAPQGQRHYLVKPGIKKVESDFWAEKKITTLDCSFEDFINSLDQEVSKQDRTLSLVRPAKSHPIKEKFVTHLEPSENLIRFITDHAEYISERTTYITNLPEEFFRGADQGWFPIAETICVIRSISKQICQVAIEKPEEERKSSAELFVIKGEAGSGKTVLLRQIAWNSRELGIGIFIWIKSGAAIDLDVIAEIHNQTKERVFLMWDDAARNSQEISKAYSTAKQRNLKVTIITSERFSEWNIRCEELDELVTNVFKLPYLNENEIIDLIGKLETYNCLGPHLINKTIEQRKAEFVEVYGRQLLVALYEATMGMPFEEIIYSEYSQIYPEGAKQIYLTICTLNRMRVPVRAGLISRIHGVNFETFKERFFKPLEKIVISKDQGQSDIHYKARHPEIAEIVFKRVLNNSIDLYNEYIRILSKLNISYESDRFSFRSLIRAKTLHDLFPAYADVNAIYEHALSVTGKDPYLLQQIANFERIRPNGNLTRAVELLEEARTIAPYDKSIVHSLALIWRERASLANEIIVKRKYRGESSELLKFAAQKFGDNSYISSVLVDLALDNLKDILNDCSATNKSIDEAIRRAEKDLLETKRKFPSDEHIFKLEARFAELLKDDERAIKALENSYTESNRDPFIATRLAAIYKELGDFPKAEETLRLALQRRATDHRLNFQFAELLRVNEEYDQSHTGYYYRRAFTPGDQNYEAQFWYARFSYESEDKRKRQEAYEIFETLRNVKLPFEDRTKIRDYRGRSNLPSSYYGSLSRKKEGFGFIIVDGSGENLFCPSQQVKEGLWEALQEGDRLKFLVGFSYSGLVSCEVEAA